MIPQSQLTSTQISNKVRQGRRDRTKDQKTDITSGFVSSKAGKEATEKARGSSPHCLPPLALPVLSSAKIHITLINGEENNRYLHGIVQGQIIGNGFLVLLYTSILLKARRPVLIFLQSNTFFYYSIFRRIEHLVCVFYSFPQENVTKKWNS